MDGRKATTSTTVGLHSSCRKSKSIRLSRELLCSTHSPSEDEPSLTSADDIQFYLDLHAYGIKSFYTIMKHKLDHFTVTGKPGGKEKYLRMEEDAFIDTVDGMIADGEKVAKKEVGKIGLRLSSTEPKKWLTCSTRSTNQ